jgi:hypothetical protein
LDVHCSNCGDHDWRPIIIAATSRSPFARPMTGSVRPLAFYAALATAILAAGCSTQRAGQPRGTTKLVYLAYGRPLTPLLGIPRGCPGLSGAALYCNPDSGRQPVGNDRRPKVTIERTAGITATAAILGAAQVGGSALTVGHRVVFTGQDSGGTAYIDARSGYMALVARFPDVGLQSGGQATASLRCERGVPLVVLARPDGAVVRPDLEVLENVPRVREFRAPNACS